MRLARLYKTYVPGAPKGTTKFGKVTVYFCPNARKVCRIFCLDGFSVNVGVLQDFPFSLYWAYPCFASFSMLCTRQYSVHWAFTLGWLRCGEAIQLLVVPQIGKHGLHRGHALTIQPPTFGAVNDLLRALIKVVR
jgi:hypothetical protein